MNFIKPILSLAMMSILTACNNVIVNKPVQATGLLNDTGIIMCTNDATTFADCTAATTGDWFGLNQDAQLGRDALAVQGQLIKVGAGDAGFDFTKISATGKKLAANAAKWSCVLDNHTGLMWEVKTNDGGLRDRNNTYRWYNSDSSTNGGDEGFIDDKKNNTQAFTHAVNRRRLCGFNNWRLPSKQELLSIVNYGKVNPAIDSTYFPNTSTGSKDTKNGYWSSTPKTYYDDGKGCWLFCSGGHYVYDAWLVKFSNGADYNVTKFHSGYVRLVRSGQ